MSDKKRGYKSGRVLKAAAVRSKELKKDYDVGKLHEGGLKIYCIICGKEVKMCHPFIVQTVMPLKKLLVVHPPKKQEINNKNALRKDDNLH